ncbi:MAG TPA: hypothetical protein VK464_10590 [Symbiobacteriaceae bacterium]|jgi:hypothetical protein|nr:hypothetical protein [Symbiobacteriaceae bacterium]
MRREVRVGDRVLHKGVTGEAKVALIEQCGSDQYFLWVNMEGRQLVWRSEDVQLPRPSHDPWLPFGLLYYALGAGVVLMLAALWQGEPIFAVVPIGFGLFVAGEVTGVLPRYFQRFPHNRWAGPWLDRFMVYFVVWWETMAALFLLLGLTK